MARKFWNGQYRHVYTVTFELISNKEDGSDVSGAAKRRAMIRKSLDLEASGDHLGTAHRFHQAFKKISTAQVMIELGEDE